MVRAETQDTSDLLRRITALPGIAGHERSAAPALTRAFRAVSDRVEVDRIGNILAWVHGTAEAPRPRALVAAHADRIGFLVRRVEPGGYLRISEVGGFDPRVLPGREVLVHSTPPIVAVFGTKPPHLQKKGEAEQVPTLSDLYLDTGRPEGEVRRHVRVGTMVSLRQEPILLEGGRMAGPGMDDRAGIVALLRMLDSLRRDRPLWDVVGVATVEEEISGGIGAKGVSEALEPTLGIALDVSHGDMIGAREEETVPLGSGPAIAIGANIHPRIHEGLRLSAKALGIPFRVEPCPVGSGTDAMEIQVARDGIPTGVVGIPCRYMHTSVEVVDTRDVDRCAHLLAHYLKGLPPDWGVTEVLK